MKPILFNTEIARAILEGRKTETRRVIKPQPGMVRLVWGPHEKSRTFSFACCGENVIDGTPVNYDETIKAPYWPGDILWVRETWTKIDGDYVYRADDEMPEGWHLTAWKSPVQMPKEAARIFLRVTNVRVERLQDITLAGMDAEGRPICDGGIMMACSPGECIRCDKSLENSIPWFQRTWDSTIKPADRPTYGWDANPWCWTIKFKRITKREAGM